MVPESTSLYLGIDTGGTFTDGVLLDPRTHQVIKTIKVLTTHHDLTLCIANVLDKLAPAEPASVALVSLSTTLATNAIAEGKRKPVALLLLGYDSNLVHAFDFQNQFGTQCYCFIQGRHGLDGVEQQALDESEVSRVANEVKDHVDALAVASYAGPRNASHEERAAEILAHATGLPVVQANHLSRELDSIRRATTASLNASLLANTQDFINAVQSMLEQHQIHCPIMIVRGDGSIVKADFARKRPVEIIHSGPATSAIGGQFLAKSDRCLVIDIGGTTTDITLVDHGRVQIEENAATVGPYRTCVKTIKARSFGLGGDSLIRFDRWKSLSIGPERVVPLAYLSHEYPQIKQDLLDWLAQKKDIVYSDRLEYWVLQREPPHTIKHDRTRKALQLLRNGPMLLARLLKQVGVVSPVQLHVDDLVNQEIILRAGFTPTDLLHVSGEFTPWDVEIARLVTALAARIWNEDPLAFASRIKQTMTHRIVAEIIQFLSDKTLSDSSLNNKNNNLDRWLYDESMQPQSSYLGCNIFLKIPIVGIGAPARSFLPAVAAALGTQIILPEHFEVANAIGTVVGSVIIQQKGEVAPQITGTTIAGYFARVASQQTMFERFEQAHSYVRKELQQWVAAEARSAGAEDAAVEIEETEVIPGAMLQLTAWAMGKPGLNESANSKDLQD